MALTVDSQRGRWGILPARDAVRANRAELMELGSTLRHAGLLYAQGSRSSSSS